MKASYVIILMASMRNLSANKKILNKITKMRLLWQIQMMLNLRLMNLMGELMKV
jgi:hypothetical protein